SLITRDRTTRALRIPAAEIEQLVTSRVRRWFLDPGGIYNVTRLPYLTAQRRLVAAAAGIGKRELARVAFGPRFRLERPCTALVQIAVTSKNASVRAVETSSPKHGVPDLRRMLGPNAQTSQSELFLPDAVQ